MPRGRRVVPTFQNEYAAIQGFMKGKQKKETFWTEDPQTSKMRSVWGRRGPARVLLLLVAVCFVARAESMRASTLLFAPDSADPQPVDDDYELADQVMTETLGEIESDQLFEVDQATSPDDIVARVGGRGRSRSDGVRLFMPSGAAEGLAFSPAQLDIGWAEPCIPAVYSVAVKNLAQRPIRIDDVRFESDSFWLATPRGIVLGPGRSINLSIIFVASQPQQIQLFIFLETSAGEFALPVRGHVKPSSFGLRGLHISLPAGSRVEHTIRMYNPTITALRVSEIYSPEGIGDVLLPLEHTSLETESSATSSWEVPSSAMKPVARYVFTASEAIGRHLSSIHLETSNQQFVIPIRIDVQKSSFIVQPSDFDVGVFTRPLERRQLSLSFHNTASHPVIVREIVVVDSDGLALVADHDESQLTVPSKTRVLRVVQLVVRNPRTDYQSGVYRAKLQIRTDTTAGESIYNVNLRGFAMRGHLSYSMSETIVRLVARDSSNTMPSKSDSHEVIAHHGEVSSHPLALWNHFDVPFEVERVFLSSQCEDFSIQSFGVGHVPASARLPVVWIQTHPVLDLKYMRTCSLQIETNASVHHVPISLFTGAAKLTSTRTAIDHIVQASSCVAHGVVDDLDHDRSSSEAAKTFSVPQQHSTLCRRVVIEMGKVARFGILEESVNVTNANPTNLQMKILVNPHSPKQSFDAKATMSFHADHIPDELAMINAAWRRSRLPNMKAINRTVAIAPGDTMSLLMRVKFKTTRIGLFLEPVLTLESKFETIHVLLRFEIVKGTIRPKLKSIEVPHIHPGRLGYVDVPFTSTLEHDVHSRGVIVESGNSKGRFNVFGLWQLPDIIPANSTTNVTLYYFPSSFYADCKREGYFSDCFVPNKSMRSTTSMSAFGSIVTVNDIKQLEIRAKEWGSALDDRGERSGISVALGTDSTLTASVDITAFVSRPSIFPSSDDGPTVSFPLTNLLTSASVLVKITNPCDVAIDFELATTREDKELFYSCDDDMTELECLGEWHDIARERFEQVRRKEPFRTPSDPHQVPPLYYKSRVVRVDGRHDGILGPIYFFPSVIGVWDRFIYVRNNLTHIEPIRIVAASGQGSLSIKILPWNHDEQTEEKIETSDSLSTKSVVFRLEDVNINTTGVHLARVIHIVNSGTLNLKVSIVLIQSSPTFELSTDNQASVEQRGNDSHRIWSFSLAPNETLPMRVDFKPDCFRSSTQSRLDVVTENGVSSFTLEGRISTKASFQCRRLLLSTAVARTMKSFWVLVSAVAMIVVATALCRVAVSRLNTSPQLVPRRSSHEVSHAETETIGSDIVNFVEMTDELKQLERLAMAGTATTLVTPAVTTLLQLRQDRAKLNTPSFSDESTPNVSSETTSSSVISSDRDSKCPKDGSMGPSNGSDRGMSHSTSHQQVMEPAAIKMGDSSPEFDSMILITQEPVGSTQSTILQGEDTGIEDVEIPGDMILSDAGEEKPVGGLIAEVSGSSFSSTPPPEKKSLDGFTLALNFDDDWSALSFESLQSEIGKLVEDDQTFGEPEYSSARIEQRGSAEAALGDSTNSQRCDVISSLSMAPPLMPMSSLFAAGGAPSLGDQSPRPSATKTAPPGFTPADATPEASRVAFEQLLRAGSPMPPSQVSDASLQRLLAPVTSGVSARPSRQPAFASSYSLFGPPVGNGSAHRPLGALHPTSGHIGSRPTRSASARESRALSKSVRPPSQLSALGGVELSAGESSSKPRRR